MDKLAIPIEFVVLDKRADPSLAGESLASIVSLFAVASPMGPPVSKESATDRSGICYHAARGGIDAY